MIYLIGGTPRSGKTTVAQKLAAWLGVPWISADTIENLVKELTPRVKRDERFPKDTMRKVTGNSNDRMYSKYSALQIQRAYVTQAQSSWKIIALLAKGVAAGNVDYIIEGHQVSPKLAAQLIKQLGQKKVKAAFLTRHSIAKTVAAAKRGKGTDDWFTKKTKDKSTYPKIAAMICGYGNYLRTEAKRYRFRTFNMDAGFSEQVAKALKYLG